MSVNELFVRIKVLVVEIAVLVLFVAFVYSEVVHTLGLLLH